MKQAITIIASEETYKNLSTFKDIDDLNETVRKYKDQFSNKLNKTSITVLELLHRYSAKYRGVSFLRKNQIGKLIGKSRRTIIRVCKQLEEHGIIRQYELKRSIDMKQTSNAIVIQPYKFESVTQEKSKKPIKSSSQKTEMSHQENNTISLKQNLNNNNRTEKPFRPSWIPEQFFNLLKAHYDNIKDIEEYWRAIHAITYKMELDQQAKENIGISAFKQMKSRRKNLKKPIAYFVGIVKKKAKKEHITGLVDAVWNF